MHPLLIIKHLSVNYRESRRNIEALRDVSLTLQEGEGYGLIGESGSGKTTLALTILRFLSSNAEISDGEVIFQGKNIYNISLPSMRQLWRKGLAFVPQDALASLNPSMRIGDQLKECFGVESSISKDESNQRVISLLSRVCIHDGKRVTQSYPYQLSGGILQRVLIAMSLAANASLIVMDEPTSALDVTTQSQILDLINDLKRQHRFSILYITHNIHIVSQICQRVGVLYRGELLEEGEVQDVFNHPYHPYTQHLLSCFPKIGMNKKKDILVSHRSPEAIRESIPGTCLYLSVCLYGSNQCKKQIAMESLSSNRAVRCCRWQEISFDRLRQPIAVQNIPEISEMDKYSLSLHQIKVNYSIHSSGIQRISRRAHHKVRALAGVDLDLPSRSTIGLIGESGSGKTTLARVICGLVNYKGDKNSPGWMIMKTAQGEEKIPWLLSERKEYLLRSIQMVFQNPEDTLNPHLTVEETLRYPLKRFSRLTQAETDHKIDELLDSVALSTSYRRRYPNQISGGEKQRVAIARGLALKPKILICDEPFSALDVSVQSVLLNLLISIQEKYKISILFISHDLAVVGYVADTIAVIYAGHILEYTPVEKIILGPNHPYTKELLSSQLANNKDLSVSKPIKVPSRNDGLQRGCPYFQYCSRKISNLCEEHYPPWQVDNDMEKKILCHIPFFD